jgi:hypothetical protein
MFVCSLVRWFTCSSVLLFVCSFVRHGWLQGFRQHFSHGSYCSTTIFERDTIFGQSWCHACHAKRANPKKNKKIKSLSNSIALKVSQERCSIESNRATLAKTLD